MEGVDEEAGESTGDGDTKDQDMGGEDDVPEVDVEASDVFPGPTDAEMEIRER